MADIRAEDAMMHPKAVLVDNIMAYKKQARVLRKLEDIESAELYEKLAKSLEAELEAVTQQAAGATQPPNTTTGENLAIPTEMTNTGGQ